MWQLTWKESNMKTALTQSTFTGASYSQIRHYHHYQIAENYNLGSISVAPKAVDPVNPVDPVANHSKDMAMGFHHHLITTDTARSAKSLGGRMGIYIVV